MAVIETWLNQDLQKPVKVQYIDGSLFSNNANGNRIGVVVTDNGEPVTISGTVSGYVVVSDGSTVPCTGAKSGNRASILIPPAAYVPGSAFISLFVTDGTTVTTLAALSTTVLQTRTGTQVDPGSVVTDWTQTINGAMQDVQTAAANLGSIVATPYASLTYPVPLGKYTYYDGGLYRCISPIASSETFTPAHWTAVKLGDDVSDLKTALSAETENAFIKNTMPFIPDFSSAYSSSYHYFESNDVYCENGLIAYVHDVPSGLTVAIRRNNVNTFLQEGYTALGGNIAGKFRVYTEDSTVTPSDYITLFCASYEYGMPQYGYMPDHLIKRFYCGAKTDPVQKYRFSGTRRSTAPIGYKKGEKITFTGLDYYIRFADPNDADITWTSPGTYTFTKDCIAVFTLRDHANISKNLVNEDLSGKIFLESAVNSEIVMIEKTVQNMPSDYVQLYPVKEYSSGYHALTLTGFDSDIIIDANGGILRKYVSGAWIDLVDKVPMSINGENIFRVYGAEANEPILYLKKGCWLRGYVNSSNRYSVLGATRATMFYDAKENTDIDCDSSMTFSVFDITGTKTDLGTQGFVSYTLNKGQKYMLVAMTADTTSAVDQTGISKYSFNRVVFPNVLSEAYYEKICHVEKLHGGQGVCCSNEYVYLFSGNDYVYKFDFDGNLIHTYQQGELGHCNSAAYYDGKIYLAETGTGKVIVVNEEIEPIGADTHTIENLVSLGCDGKNFYYTVYTSLVDNKFGYGVKLYKCDLDWSNETLIKSTVTPDGFVGQGMELTENEIILVCLDGSYRPMLRYCDKETGDLIGWRYVQLDEEVEDCAINKNGRMYISYQVRYETSPVTYGSTLVYLTNYIEENAQNIATSIASGMQIGGYKEPFRVRADGDHLFYSGKITGSNFVQNVARLPAVLVPHVIYKFINNGKLTSAGSTATNNVALPMMYSVDSVTDGYVTFDNVCINLKNKRFNS